MPQDKFSGLPKEVAARARKLHDVGLPATEALGLAVIQLQYKADWEVEEIADAWGVEYETLLSYKSKGKDKTHDALRQVVLSYGGNRVILAEWEGMRHPDSHTFIVADFHSNGAYEDAQSGHDGVAIVRAVGGGSGGQPGRHIAVNVKDSYVDLDTMADEKYRTEEFGSFEAASKWYNLLTRAGLAKDTLPDPSETLPSGNPDSADHFQHKMQSYEPTERRQRPPEEGW